MRDGNRLRVDLSEEGGFASAFKVIFPISVILILVIGFSGIAKTMGPGLVVGILLFLGIIAWFFIRSRTNRPSILSNQLVIDPGQQAIFLPKQMNGGAQIPFSSLRGIEVQQVTFSGSRTTTYRYAPILSWRAPEGTERSARLVHWDDPAQAEGFVRWFRNEVGLKSYESPKAPQEQITSESTVPLTPEPIYPLRSDTRTETKSKIIRYDTRTLDETVRLIMMTPVLLIGVGILTFLFLKGMPDADFAKASLALGLSGGFATLFGGWKVGSILRNKWIRAQLAGNGKTAAGKIFAVRRYEMSSSQGECGYEITVTYRDLRGMPRQGKEIVWDQGIAQAIEQGLIRKGSDAEVRFMPGSDVIQVASVSTSEPEPETAGISPAERAVQIQQWRSPRQFGTIMCLFVGGAFLAGIMFFVPPNIYFRRIQTVLFPTERVVGAIVSEGDTGKSTGGSEHSRGTPIDRVTYEYEVSGHMFRTADELEQSSLYRVRVGGQRVLVTYVRSRPEISALYPAVPILGTIFYLAGSLVVLLGLSIAFGWLDVSPGAQAKLQRQRPTWKQFIPVATIIALAGTIFLLNLRKTSGLQEEAQRLSSALRKQDLERDLMTKERRMAHTLADRTPVPMEEYLRDPQRHVGKVIEGVLGFTSERADFGMPVIRFALRGQRRIYFLEMGDTMKLVAGATIAKGSILKVRFVPLKLLSQHATSGVFEVIGVENTNDEWKDRGEGLPEYPVERKI
ncbi:MAG TPA: hypothetical protein VI895_07440 [Bdellovibrionota bacterium]|nr:hypothetical protein [Bdellovibrionota bacterium]